MYEIIKIIYYENNNKYKIIPLNKYFNQIIFKAIIIMFIYFYFFIKSLPNSEFPIKNSIPKISIFLPIYNKAKYLQRSISSIQRQSIKNIEIIAVNDCSTDNSLEILIKMTKKDSRIKIINNKKNHGLLFSRAMGILISKGEYLMNLDPDDEYSRKNNFKLLYNIAQNLKVDFITFFIFYLPNKEKSIQYSKFNKILYQPELFESAFDNNYYLIDYYITNKFIKRDLLEKAFNSFKSEIYGEKWNYHEDNIWSILIHKLANSSVFINKKIYYYYMNNIDSEMFNRGNALELKNLLLRNKMFKKIFKFNYEKNYIIAGYIELVDKFVEHLEILKKVEELKIKSINDLKDLKKANDLSEEIKKKFDYLVNF